MMKNGRVLLVSVMISANVHLATAPNTIGCCNIEMADLNGFTRKIRIHNVRSISGYSQNNPDVGRILPGSLWPMIKFSSLKEPPYMDCMSTKEARTQ